MAAGSQGSPVANGRARGLASELYNMLLSEVVPAPQALPDPLKPSPTGCSMKGVTKTLVVIAGLNGKRDRMRAALERTKAVADIARANNNDVHYVFLGGALPPHGAADEQVVDWMVALATSGSSEYLISGGPNVHLLVGPREIQALSIVASDGASASLKQYLELSKFVECLGPETMDEHGTGGCWLKCTSTQAGTMVGRLPGVGVQGKDGARAEWIQSQNPLSAIAWKDEMNKRWHALTTNPAKVRAQKPNHWQFWMIIGVQSALDAEQLPAAGLNTNVHDSVAVFARQTAAFGTVRRTLVVNRRSRMLLPGACWLDVGVTSDSLFWATQTWCHSTMKAINAHAVAAIDRTPLMSELQYDVSCTLSSLVQHSEQGDSLSPPVAPWANFGKLRGQLGPCVSAGRNGQEIMRAVHWTGPEMPDLIMLLPEVYVQYVLQDYHQGMVGALDLGARSASGFLVLDNSNIVAMRMPGVSEAEQADAHSIMGPRLWKYTPRTERGDGATKQMTAAPAWRSLLRYRVADSADPPELLPGQHIGCSTGRTIFYTHTTAADSLSGLIVRWIFAPKESGAQTRDLPTLDVDNDQFQSAE